MSSKYTINSFFSGIGGFDIAFENSGFSTKMLCEINPFCNKILERHWPKVKKYTDINSVVVREIPEASIWCGGFPCQDISVARGASERLGLNGSRSGLFFQFANLIQQKNPEIVVIENVAGLFTSNKGRDFGVIIQTLSNLGYSIAWRLFNSRYFGVPQSRTRVYLCCWKNNIERAVNVMFDREGASKPHNERLYFITEDENPENYPKVPKVAYCLAASSGRHTGTDWSRTYVVCEQGVRRLSPLESERLQGFPDNWTLPDGLNDSQENIDSYRYTAIGNAVTIPVVEWIAKRIKKELGRKESYSDGIDSFLNEFKDLSQKKWDERLLSEIDFSDESRSYKWAKGGIVWNDRFLETNISPTPSAIMESSLISLIERNQTNSLYFLTPNAAEGILRRVDNQNRTLFAPLRKALESLSKNK
jgi:DNA (cytosine-5)-methyltransferase 1